MINVTEYLKEKGIYTDEKISNFLRCERVKYLIASGEKVDAHPGRYGGTFFSEGLFEWYKKWLEKKPIPLFNRKEYEVSDFLESYYGAEIVRQYKHGGFIYDWYIPSKNLLVEFNESTHNTSHVKVKDVLKIIGNCFVISEKSVMADLANLVKQHPKALEGYEAVLKGMCT